ncbi:hypothetical protein SRHO_G00122300 [Serrasalmus rhombeus]
MIRYGTFEETDRTRSLPKILEMNFVHLAATMVEASETEKHWLLLKPSMAFCRPISGVLGPNVTRSSCMLSLRSDPWTMAELE